LPPDAFPGLQICQNCFCGRGSAPDPLAGLRGLLLRGGGEDGEGRGKECEGEGREEEGRERKGRRGRQGRGKLRPLSQITGSAPVTWQPV